MANGATGERAVLGVAVRNAEFLRWVINSLPSRLVSTRRNVRLGHGERGAAEPPLPAPAGMRQAQRAAHFLRLFV